MDHHPSQSRSSSSAVILPYLPSPAPSAPLRKHKRKSLVPGAAVKLGGLGPDKDSEEYTAKVEKYRKQKEYAENVRKLANSGPSPRTSIVTDRSAPVRNSPSRQNFSHNGPLLGNGGGGTVKSKVDEAAARREKAKLYAAQIKKPSSFIETSSLRQDNSRQNSFVKNMGVAAAAEAAETTSLLRRMEEEHAKETALVESIRKQLKI
ncbi:hypothetical protein HDV00_009875 [Rhizophlyctis rosea]|nr:hypothetical protein HDV00_009875 [Rhizophlyctis rosea]